jgi:hypothetical protein
MDDFVGSLRRILHALRVEFSPELVYELTKHVDSAVRDIAVMRQELERAKEAIAAVSELAEIAKTKMFKDRDKLRSSLIAVHEVVSFYVEGSLEERAEDDGEQARRALFLIDAIIETYPVISTQPPKMHQVEWVCDCGHINKPDAHACTRCGRVDEEVMG